MTTQEFKMLFEITSVKYQAVCKEDGFRGPLRNDEDDAYDDADAYGRLRGNENKIIEVLIIQTHSR